MYLFQRILNDVQANCVPTDVKMIPQRLKPLGYKSSIFGKWHQGFCKEDCLPNNRGFDHFYGFLTGATTYYGHVAGEE